MRIGVLALQGGFAAHASALHEIGHTPVLLRAVEDFFDLAGLVLPGGESTTQLKLIEANKLREPLTSCHRQGLPILATCAGAILIAAEVRNPAQECLDWLDVCAERNAWGRQSHSFEAVSEHKKLPLIFIRAPKIIPRSNQVRVVDTFASEPVLVHQDHVWAATFHPELSQNRWLHRTVFGGRQSL